jgi:hypothetical protein
MLGLSIILGSYIPSMAYYNYHRRHYNEFLREVSIKYKDQIKDDYLEETFQKKKQ